MSTEATRVSGRRHGSDAAASDRQPGAADRRLRLLAGVGADRLRRMGHRRGRGGGLAAGPARIELRHPRSAGAGAAHHAPGAPATSRPSNAGAPGWRPAGRRGRSAPRIGSWARRWRACWWRWISRTPRPGPPARMSPTRRCSRWRPCGSTCRSRRRWPGMPSPGPRRSPARPSAWFRSGRTPDNACWRRRARPSPRSSNAPLALPDHEIGSAAPGQAIASARHETLYSRLFRS